MASPRVRIRLCCTSRLCLRESVMLCSKVSESGVTVSWAITGKEIEPTTTNKQTIKRIDKNMSYFIWRNCKHSLRQNHNHMIINLLKKNTLQSLFDIGQ